MWKKRSKSIYDEKAYSENRDKITDSNLRFYSLFNHIMIVLLMILYASTFFTDYAGNLISVYWIFIMTSTIELLIQKYLQNVMKQFAEYVVYWGIAKAYTFCLLTSVIFNQEGPAITYYIFLILIPVSFLVKRRVMYGTQTAAAVIFCIDTLICKPMDIASGDVLSCFLFYVISLVIAGQIQELRINNISMAASEHKRSVLLGSALKIARLCTWEYDCYKKQITPTYTPSEFAAFGHMVDNVPESTIQCGKVHKDSVEIFRSLFQRAEAGEEKIKGDVLLRAKEDDEFRWFHIVGILQPGAEGSGRRYIGISEDITERKNRELQYEEQLKILDNSNEVNLITKGQWNLTTNRQEVRLSSGNVVLALQGEETYDGAMKALTDTIFPQKKQEEMKHKLERKQLIEEYRKGNDTYTFRYQRTALNKRYIWVKMYVRVCRVPGKEDIMAFGFSYDITEEVLNRNIIQRLVAVEHEFLGTIDVKTGISMVQSAQEELQPTLKRIGIYQEVVDFDTAFAGSLENVVPEMEIAFLKKECSLKSLLEHLEKELIIQIPFTILQDGMERRKNLEFCYLSEEKDTILYFRSDITEMYRKEQLQLKKTEQALQIAQYASAAKTDFFSRMSHDMRTPMNGILGLACLSEEEEDPVILKENMSKIRESGEYLLGLINDTLDFQKIESGRLVLVPQIVFVHELVNNVWNLVQNTAKSKGVELVIENKNVDLDVMIKADPMRIKQILLNLISNAIKFTNPGGMVAVSIECTGYTGNMVHDVITVRDTGIGMSEEFLKDGIFQPFSQEQNDVIANYAGSGLGLSIVKKLVELMHGSITVESRLGEGTTFLIQVDFEVADETESAQIQNGEALRKERLQEILLGKKILLAEDHPLNAEIATKLLAKAGCDVHWVKDGKECLETFSKSERGRYDLILMDIRMPYMDGMEAAANIRKLKRIDAKTIPIIAMTANAYEEDVKKALDVGMDAHLAKPIDPMMMYETIAKELCGSYEGKES